MFFRAVTTPLMTPVPNFNKWCAVSNFLFKNIDFCIFTPKTPLVKENYFLTLWNFTYLKDTSFGKKLCNFELGLETKNEFEKWPLYNFVSVYISVHKAKATPETFKHLSTFLLLEKYLLVLSNILLVAFLRAFCLLS